MIRHIVLFSASADRFDEIIAGLRLLADIPHSRHWEVSRNMKVDPLSEDVDIVVYAEFDDEAALAAYKAHPIYVEATRRVKPLRDKRYAVDVVAG